MRVFSIVPAFGYSKGKVYDFETLTGKTNFRVFFA
jgi:hypothetical protein